MQQYVGFKRGPRETIDEVLAQWEYTKLRAEQDGGFVMNVGASAMFLLQVVGENPREAIELMRPLGTQIPQTPAELTQMQDDMRPTLHILKGNQGNIAECVRGGSQSTHYAEDDQAAWTDKHDETSTYFGAQPGEDQD